MLVTGLRAALAGIGIGDAHFGGIIHGAIATAWSRGNDCAVRAGARMPQERTDSVRSFGREDVLELAGLLLDFLFVHHAEALGEQTLGEAMAANDVGSALASPGRELDHELTVAEVGSSGLQGIMAGIDDVLVSMGLGWVGPRRDQAELVHFLDRNGDRQRSVHFHAAHFSGLAVLLQD